MLKLLNVYEIYRVAAFAGYKPRQKLSLRQVSFKGLLAWGGRFPVAPVRCGSSYQPL